MIKIRWITRIVLAISISMVTFSLDRNPSQAINLKRNTETENDFIVQQLQLLKQNSRTALKLLDDIDVVRLAFGLPKANNPVADAGYQSLSLSLSPSLGQYQYQTYLTAKSIAPEVGEVLGNLTNTISQLDFARTSSNNVQVQILAQSSFEDVDKDVYYYEGKLIEQPRGEAENVVRTVLSASGFNSRGFSNLQAIKKDNLTLQALGNNPDGMLSFFSGIQKLKTESVSLEAENIQLGNIRTILANSSSNKIERSRYQVDLEEQNQQSLEEQEQRREDLQKRLEKEKEKREKEKQKAEEQRQKDLDDAREQREDRIEKLRQNQGKLESRRFR